MKEFKDMTEEEITKIVMDSIREEYDKVGSQLVVDYVYTGDEYEPYFAYHTECYVEFLEGLLVAAFVEKAEAARIQGIL